MENSNQEEGRARNERLIDNLKHDLVAAFRLVFPLVDATLGVFVAFRALTKAPGHKVSTVAYLDVRATLYQGILHDKNTCFETLIFTFFLQMILSGGTIPLLLARYSKLRRSLPWYTAGDLAVAYIRALGTKATA
jgi:hypothetical protein